MKRKKWTAQEEVTDELLRFREKRKWQLAFRRYIVEQSPSPQYASFFGLPIQLYREWIQTQFVSDQSWENFGKAWQFEHVIPVTYFDFGDEKDLKLCWSFINIRVESLESSENPSQPGGILAAKKYFQTLSDLTTLDICQQMIGKIELIEETGAVHGNEIAGYIQSKKELIEQIGRLAPDEFNQLNSGSTIEEVLLEREILKKFGG